ncbi:DNA topoisomerase I [Candidatus Uhrbacteria bacterium RIFOXYB12_FULL_58_10]|uniref:DNA topoisomerase 1 n=1 Tax=Candidatus Uhrbacteria bacterium RIFOXYB2_FULL_57_15 TaxID=1802422 RepID=A0A1F7W887_9BACT|nr:MAG: DNA topoisomerase I [Candidatus Uhrbacteria bacterium RIFOXYB12_FULL_58_10]OGL98999.1 MAG: DNA topoisomerase I [Candidatus Uhrbacteria bacterium RIFOXYB2_FULL_57_15]OGM00220.1 MAG: DNA topoisomerase I [Candidatus Uhrbacteria bacterium RIFOXYC12_FULL_57_11]
MSKHLVIVESPTKAKTINKFLGKDYRVLSSFGHIRDLPQKKTGVDVEKHFKPTYEVPDKAKEHVKELKAAAKDAGEIILATDEDREGEAIAWHIAETLGLDPEEAKRITFHEITQSAINHALETPRRIDMNLVNAQQTRRILDRLVGYELSPFLWSKIRRGLSAGRVQSVALRLVVERERERTAFNVEEYWTIDAEFEKDGMAFPGALFAIQGKKLDKLEIKTADGANAIVETLKGKSFAVTNVEKKEVSKAPPTPFTTSALQIEANSRLGFGAKQTMTLAQKLYETGRITYMRTDSVNLADAFITETQGFVKEQYGDAYAMGGKKYVTKAKGAQEAHEAIRPTSVTSDPEALKGSIDAGLWKLYDLIWRRTVASQLPPAKVERTSIDLEAGGHTFRANGSIVKFDGFMKVYRATQEKILPALASGDAVANTSITPTQHFTEPAARYSDATLVKALEEYGIGRPSTYAPTIATIEARQYVERDDNKKLFPTDTGMIVNDVLVEHFPNIVDYAFTATMENTLDEIADGKVEWVPTLEAFYGPFHRTIQEKSDAVSREDVMKERVVGADPKTGLPVIVRSGRFGPFAQLGEYTAEDKKEKKPKPKSASLPKGANTDTVTLEEILPLFEMPRVVGTTETGDEIVANLGRFGPYLKAGDVTASIPPDFHPATITEAQARGVIKNKAETKAKQMAPLKELGNGPDEKPVIIRNGRFGPYITDGTTNVSVPKKLDPMEITLEQALEMLEKKRTSPPRKFPRKKTPAE